MFPSKHLIRLLLCIILYKTFTTGVLHGAEDDYLIGVMNMSIEQLIAESIEVYHNTVSS
jgi:hypothetical protein